MNKDFVRKLAEALEALGKDKMLVDVDGKKYEVHKSVIDDRLIYVETAVEYIPNIGEEKEIWYLDKKTGEVDTLPF